MVPRLRRSNSYTLNPGIEGAAEHENTRHDSEAIASPSPCLDHPSTGSHSVAVHPTRNVDHNEEEVRCQTEEFDESKPELRLAEAFDTEQLES